MPVAVHECAVDPVRTAVAGLCAAATAAADRAYLGLAAQLEDLAAVLDALPNADSDSLACALLSLDGIK